MPKPYKKIKVPVYNLPKFKDPKPVASTVALTGGRRSYWSFSTKDEQNQT